MWRIKQEWERISGTKLRTFGILWSSVAASLMVLAPVILTANVRLPVLNWTRTGAESSFPKCFTVKNPFNLVKLQRVWLCAALCIARVFLCCCSQEHKQVQPTPAFQAHLPSPQILLNGSTSSTDVWYVMQKCIKTGHKVPTNLVVVGIGLNGSVWLWHLLWFYIHPKHLAVCPIVQIRFFSESIKTLVSVRTPYSTFLPVWCLKCARWFVDIRL